MENMKWGKWGIFTACWFIGTFAVFFLSEKFKDVDAVMYPSLFILIGSMVIGPGAIGLMFPLENNGDRSMLRKVAVFFSYVVCFLIMRGLSLLCFRIGLL